MDLAGHNVSHDAEPIAAEPSWLHEGRRRGVFCGSLQTRSEKQGWDVLFVFLRCHDTVTHLLPHFKMTARQRKAWQLTA